jgi:hypothetical protein
MLFPAQYSPPYSTALLVCLREHHSGQLFDREWLAKLEAKPVPDMEEVKAPFAIGVSPSGCCAGAREGSMATAGGLVVIHLFTPPAFPLPSGLACPGGVTTGQLPVMPPGAKQSPVA